MSKNEQITSTTITPNGVGLTDPWYKLRWLYFVVSADLESPPSNLRRGYIK